MCSCLLRFVQGCQAMLSCQICHSNFLPRVHVCLSPSYFPTNPRPWWSRYRVIATYTQPLSPRCRFSQCLGNAGPGLYRFLPRLSLVPDVSVLWTAWTSGRTFQCTFPYRTSSKPESPMSALFILRSRTSTLIPTRFRSHRWI